MDKAAGFASGRLRMAEPAGEVLRLPARVLKNKHACGEKAAGSEGLGWVVPLGYPACPQCARRLAMLPGATGTHLLVREAHPQDFSLWQL